MLRPEKLNKLKAVVHKSRLDDVLLSLGREGSIHFIDLKTRSDIKGSAHETSHIYFKSVASLAKISRLLKNFGVEEEEKREFPIKKRLSEEDIDSITKELDAIESRQKDILNSLADLERILSKEDVTTISESLSDLTTKLKETTKDLPKNFEGLISSLSSLYKTDREFAGISLQLRDFYDENDSKLLSELVSSSAGAQRYYKTLTIAMRIIEKVKADSKLLMSEIDNELRKTKTLEDIFNLTEEVRIVHESLTKLFSKLDEQVKHVEKTAKTTPLHLEKVKRAKDLLAEKYLAEPRTLAELEDLELTTKSCREDIYLLRDFLKSFDESFSYLSRLIEERRRELDCYHLLIKKVRRVDKNVLERFYGRALIEGVAQLSRRLSFYKKKLKNLRKSLAGYIDCLNTARKYLTECERSLINALDIFASSRKLVDESSKTRKELLYSLRELTPPTDEEKLKKFRGLWSLNDKLEALHRLLTEKGKELGKLWDFLRENCDKVLEYLLELTEPLKKNKSDALRRKLERDSAQYKDRLLYLRALLEAERRIEEAKTHFRETQSVAYLEGWVPKREIKSTIESVKKSSGGLCLAENKEPDRHENVPVLLRNPKILEPFQKLVTSYALPKSKEWDPTILLAITFPIFFAFMFPDVGHGLLLTIFGFAVYYLRGRVKKTGDIVRNILSGAELYIIAGVLSILTGLMFGEFFGVSLKELGFEKAPLGFLLAYIPGIEREFSLLESEGALLMLKLSVYIGMLHIISGILLNLINKLINREYKEMLEPIFWLWYYLGLITAVFTYGIRITDWLANIANIAVLIFLPIILMFITSVYLRGGVEGFAHTFEIAITFVSHTISYGRLLAVALIHAVMSSLLAEVGASNILLLLAVTVTGNLTFIMMLEGFIAFVQSLRLHWVEWFSKFYEGGGVAFRPFRLI